MMRHAVPRLVGYFGPDRRCLGDREHLSERRGYRQKCPVDRAGHHSARCRLRPLVLSGSQNRSRLTPCGVTRAIRKTMRPRHHERHTLQEVGWLRASVLGANDGIVSISSLILGVAAAHVPHTGIVLSGIAGLVAGAMSMATGEYVSVHSQADSQAAALAQERTELEVDYAAEGRELTEIYIRRGLDAELAGRVSEQLM